MPDLGVIGRTGLHAANMIGTYIGLWGAFIGVVGVPQRLVPQAFQANWMGMTTLSLAVVAAGLIVVYGIAMRARGCRHQPSRASHGRRAT